MHKRAIIFDLDNTIYPVHSIGSELFSPLFQLINDSGNHIQNMEQIRADIMRRPFQLVAAEFSFSDDLTQQGIMLLKNLTYEKAIEPFDDYHFARNLPTDKYLVTTGFLKLQQSKVKAMNLEADFKEIHIVDPSSSSLTKKDVFADIMKRHKYNVSDLLVIGDDLHSEIKAAQQLGIDVVLYDKLQLHNDVTSLHKISDFQQLVSLVDNYKL
jgi:putative hydrolase of the HAD superfamily